MKVHNEVDENTGQFVADLPTVEEEHPEYNIRVYYRGGRWHANIKDPPYIHHAVKDSLYMVLVNIAEIVEKHRNKMLGPEVGRCMRCGQFLFYDGVMCSTCQWQSDRESVGHG